MAYSIPQHKVKPLSIWESRVGCTGRGAPIDAATRSSVLRTSSVVDRLIPSDIYELRAIDGSCSPGKLRDSRRWPSATTESIDG